MRTKTLPGSLAAWPLAFWLVACGGGNGDPSDGGEDGDGGECVPSSTCVPFAWSCLDGEPVECNDAGDSWIPRDPCPAGQTCNPDTGWCECGPCEIHEDGACVRVGAECPSGWTDDGECGCEPVLETCAPREIAAIGGGCVAVGPRSACGTGTWGSIPTDPDTIYVDASYTAGGSDGSALRPFVSIGEAVAAADPGSPRTIAIAAGTYVEDVVLDRPVALHGRCPEMVVVSPAGIGSAVSILASGASVRSLTVDALTRSDFGILVEGCTSAAIEDVAVISARNVGIMGRNSAASLARVSVTAVGTSSASHGDGIHFRRGTGTRCSLDVENTDVATTYGGSIRVEECDLDVRDSRARGALWEGIRVDAVSDPVAVSITGCHVSDAYGMGILVTYLGDVPTADSPVVSRNVVTDIHAEPAYEVTAAIIVQFGSGTGVVSENLVADSDTVGIATTGPSVEILGNGIRDLTEDGIYALLAGASTVEDNTVDRTVLSGIVAYSVDSGSILRNAVRGVAADLEGDAAGIGIAESGTATIDRNSVESDMIGIVASIMTGPVLVGSNRVLAGKIGIAVDTIEAAVDVSVVGNRIFDVPCGVFGGDVGALLVSDNLVGPIRSIWPGDTNESVGIMVAHVGDLEVSGNRTVLYVSDVDDNASAAIAVADVAGVVSGNRIAADVMVGITYQPFETVLPRDVSIVDNTVVGVAGVGINIDETLAGSSYLISGNRVAGTSDAPWYDGAAYGDGIVLRWCNPASEITITGNRLLANDRTGLFVSGSTVSASGNEFIGNAISMAWQDGAVVDLGENTVQCNGSDQPWVDEGMSVPDPPDIGMPVI